MNKKLHDFLKSGLLDKYVIGDTSAQETSKVETYLDKYPELQEEYEILQEQLEINARANAVKTPTNTLDDILTTIHDTTVIEMNTKPRIPYWFSIAASLAALVFAGTSFIFYNKSNDLKKENNTIAEEIFDLRDDIDNNNKKLDNVMSELKKLNDPETYKYVLRGNERAKELKTVAYINPINKSSLIDVVSLPKLSDEQYYKMWAQVNDKMIDLGILNTTNGNLKSVPYIEDALSLSITIENKNGIDISSSEKEVAQINLENE
jgi:predicted nuclease with TOPRIM domain